MGLLIRNGTIVTASDRWRGDVRCADGRIVELGRRLEPAGEEVVDASGQLVLPGGVDPHVHLSLPVAGTVSADDFDSGTLAALAGGTTTVVDFVHPERGQAIPEALEDRKREADDARCDVAFHMAITWWGDETAAWMERCVLEEGIPTFKVYLAYLDTVGLGDRDLVRVLETAAALPARVVAHAEHGPVIERLRDRLAAEGGGPELHPRSRPPEAEGEATARLAVLAGLTDCPVYVVHVTCREAMEAIAAARLRGAPVTGETCPQYLLLDDSVYSKPDFEGAAYVIAPPIRPRGHGEILWRALAAGTLQAVGTDHCPFTMEQKRLGIDDFRKIPGGAAGIEHRLALLWTHGVRTGRFDVHRFVDLVATAPARLMGLHPRKGTIAPGADADLVVWDPEATSTISASTHRHRTDRSIYEGFEARGRATTVVARGRVAVAGGEIRARPGDGRFVERRLESTPVPGRRPHR